MAYVRIQKEKIFINSQDRRTPPRIIGKRKIDASNNVKGLAIEKPLEFLKIELACPVDQRKILTEDIGSIRVFLSLESHASLKRRFDVLNPDAPRILNSERGSIAGVASKGPAGLGLERRGSESQRDRSTPAAKYPPGRGRALDGVDLAQKASSAAKSANFTRVVNDIDFLNQKFNQKKFSRLRKLCEVNVNQELASRKVSLKDYQNKSDEEVFGERKRLEMQSRSTSVTRSGRKERSVSLSQSEALAAARDLLTGTDQASMRNFVDQYFKNVTQGKDPLSSFMHPDQTSSLQERMKGVISINKFSEDQLRQAFRTMVEEEINTRNELSGMKITVVRESKREVFYKTSFEISADFLKNVGSKSNLNLIYYAFNKKGMPVDSYGEPLILSKLFASQINPTLDFNISASRNNRGNVITKISNEELQFSEFNLYQKDFSKSRKYQDYFFQPLALDIPVRPAGEAKLVDGLLNVKIGNKIDIPKSRTVFQRCKPIFRNSELANTKSVGVPAKVFDSKNLSCSVSVKIEEGQGVISIGNLSENVLAVLPVKRVAIGKRGSNFDTVRFLEGNNLVPNTKRFVRTGDESIGFTFIDDDLEEDTIYEYSAILYGRSGNRQLASARFLEKKTSRTGLVDLEVKSLGMGTTINDEGQPQSKISFTVAIQREENDVDKIFNTLFGDNRRLFDTELDELKDASNLIHGVRVHKINTKTSEYSFVGSFRGFKQKGPQDTADSDLPKTYQAVFEDESPANSEIIYKFEPYVMPPAQIFDKAIGALQNIATRRGDFYARAITSRSAVRSSSESIVSTVGSKYASLNRRKGAISSAQAFMEKNKNDLFLESLTGDIVYKKMNNSSVIDFFTNPIELKRSSVTRLKTLDVDPDTSDYIPKNILRVNFTLESPDPFVDFYVIVRTENGEKQIIIDGAVGRLVEKEDKIAGPTYKYLSQTKTSVGLVSYYAVPISIDGVKGAALSLGSISMRGD
jgi:hypothetical protein